MLVWRITAASTFSCEAVIRRTKICNSHYNGCTRNAPSQVIYTTKLKAGATDLAPLKQGLGQSNGCLTIAGFHKVSITAGPTDGIAGIGSRVVGGTCGAPFGLRSRLRGKGGRVVMRGGKRNED